uniref:Uncharacterized protein n=1 Tax=Nelumbo nucifera TaxID=4432 RepID=A0A822ZC98_NELNU|nr:TPA_asm: hypothetical protein HUJ06_015406 [Nelumbo nucifera]
MESNEKREGEERETETEREMRRLEEREDSPPQLCLDPLLQATVIETWEGREGENEGENKNQKITEKWER